MPRKLVAANCFVSGEHGARFGHGARWGQQRRRNRRRGWLGTDGHTLEEEAPLSRASVGSAVEVTQILGDESFRGRIMALGVVPGALLNVLSGGRGRPLVIALSGGRLLLDGGSSESILVRGREPETCNRTPCCEGGMRR